MRPGGFSGYSVRAVSPYAAITFVCIAVYARTLFFGITNADDEVLITGSLPFLKDFSNIVRVFALDAFYAKQSIDLYRPLQSATYILDAQWGGDPVFAAHCTNLLLHLLSCLTVYHLLLRLDFRQRLAFAGALIYAAHYLFMTAVAWLPARGDLLLALFTFLALIFLIRSLEERSWSAVLLHLTFFTLALFSKESGVVLPVLFAVYLLTSGKTGMLGKRHLLLPVGYLSVTPFYWFMKGEAVAASGDERGIVPLLKNLWVFPETVAKFFLPVNMSTLPEYRLHAVLTGAVIMLLLLALHLYRRELQARRTLFYPTWFLLFIIPGMTYYPNFYFFAKEHIDHRSYLICFGLLALVLNSAQQFELDRKKYFTAATALLLAYLAVLNLRYSGSYRDPASFALRAITVGSTSTFAYANYGVEKLLKGDDIEALGYLNQSLRLCGKYMPALHHRARIYRARGMNREALADLDTLLAVDPTYDAADYVLRGSIRLEMRDDAGAKSDFEAALRLDPDRAEARRGLRMLPGSGAP